MLGISTTRAISRKTKGFNKVAKFLQSQQGFAASYFARGEREVRPVKSEYDLNSAITFLLVGLGIGSVLAMLFDPKQRVKLEGIKRDKGVDSWRPARLHQQEEAKERVA